MNKALLKYEMERRHISVSDMVSAMGISRAAFWRKCSGITEFKLSEIKTIIEILNLEKPSDIFFTK